MELSNSIVKQNDLLVGSMGRKSQYGFAIHQPSGKHYILFAESLLELKEWMKAIVEVVEEMKRQEKKLRTNPEDIVGLPESQVSHWEIEEEDYLDTVDYPFNEEDSPGIYLPLFIKLKKNINLQITSSFVKKKK
jgi:hypothetical protein